MAAGKKDKRGKKGKEEKKEPAEMLVRYTKLAGLDDLARNSSSFGDGVRPVFSIKEGAQYHLLSMGPKIGDSRLALRLDSKKGGCFLVYRPKSQLDSQMLELRDSISIEGAKPDLVIIPIMEMLTNPFKESGKETKKVKLVRVRDDASLVKATIMRSMGDEHVGKVYAFTHKSKRYLGSFTLLEDDDFKVLCYAETGAQVHGFFRYNYSTDKVEATDTFGEHPFMYVRVINLAEPFQFFKPEE